MTGGLLLALGGVWLGCQVFGGDALGRLGIVTPSTSAGGAGSSSGGAPATLAGAAAQATTSAASGVAGAVMGTQSTLTKPPLQTVGGSGS